MELSLPDCRIVRLQESTVIKPFACGDADLDEFLLKDAKAYTRELLAVTNLFEYGDRTVAFYSVLNDRIVCEMHFPDRSPRDRFLKRFPWSKRSSQLPAVKVGRLGVGQEFRRMKIGTQILDTLKMSFTTRNKTGCRFITVDAYNNEPTLAFYGANGFEFLSRTDEAENTRLMYFDLMAFVNTQRSVEEANTAPAG